MRNFLELNKITYDKLCIENISKSYKKSDYITYNEIHLQTKDLASKLGTVDRAKCLAKNEAFHYHEGS